MASQIVDEAAARGDVSEARPVYAACTSVVSGASEPRPHTLSQAAECIDHESKEWDASRAPSPAAWVGLSRKLALTERAASALTGLHEVVRQHHFASQSAADSEVEYIGITDYQAGCIDDAIDLLIWDVVYALGVVRDATKTPEGD